MYFIINVIGMKGVILSLIMRWEMLIWYIVGIVGKFGI